MRTHALCGKHLADDIAVGAGTPVYSVADGIVRFTKDKNGLGHAIHIEHKLPSGDYLTSIYYHLVRKDMGGVALEIGQRVGKGEHIGVTSALRTDTSGGAPHLHFGLRREGSAGYRGATHGQPSTNEADALRFFDERTNVWYYAGYTSIFSGGIRQCDVIGVEADKLDSTHDDIVSEWEADPREFIRSRLTNVSGPSTLLVDTFESYAANTFPTSGGWAIRPGASGSGASLQQVVSGTAYNGSQSLRLVSAAGLGVNVHRTATLPTTTRYMVEGYVNTTSSTYKNVYLGVGGSPAGGDLAASIRFMAGGALSDANLVQLSGSYAPNTWTRLRVIVSPVTGLYSAYVGDALVGSNRPLALPASMIEQVWFAVDNSGPGGLTGTTAYFDDISLVDCGPIVNGTDACPSAAGNSSLVTVQVRGTVTQIPNPAALTTAAATYGFPVIAVAIGDPYTFTYTYNPSIVDSLPSNAIYGDYAAISRATLVTSRGAYTFEGPTLYRPGPIAIVNGAGCSGGQNPNGSPCDQYYATVQSQFSPPNSAEGSLYVQTFLQDADASAFASDALPSDAPTLGLFEQASFTAGVANSGGSFTGTITSIVRTP